MAGYAVLEHVSAVPHRHRSVEWRVAAPSMRAIVEIQASGTATIEDDVDTLRERVARLREVVGQTTWYLFNAEGWR